MKKILIAVLILLAAIALVGCTQKDANNNSPNTNTGTGETIGAATGITDSDLAVNDSGTDEQPDSTTAAPDEPLE